MVGWEPVRYSHLSVSSIGVAAQVSDIINYVDGEGMT
jgi:hypothetical protein